MSDNKYKNENGWIFKPIPQEKQFKDITGKKFNKLTCLGFLGYGERFKSVTRGNGRPIYAFKCECGGEKYAYAGDVKSGNTSSCGCIPRKKKGKDYTGKRFGKLIAQFKIAEEGKKTKYICLCDCGNKKEVYASNLVTGTTQSCGCFAPEISSKRNEKDLQGLKFGALKIIKRVQDRGVYPKKYECKCDCGNKSIISHGHIMQSTSRTCGKCDLKPLATSDKEFLNILKNRFRANITNSFKKRGCKKIYHS